MPSRRRIQPPNPPARASAPAPQRQPGVPMLPAILAAAVGHARHDRHLAGTRLGASRRLGPARPGTAQRQDLAPGDRERYVQEAAYYRYLQRGGSGGSAEGDWYAAEADLKRS